MKSTLETLFNYERTIKVRRFDPTILIFLGIMAYMSISDGRFENPMVWFQNTLILLPGIIIAIALHEFAHAYSAYKLGDYTPKVQGRVTLNPIKHLDPIGTLLIIFIGFGWGRPVMVNPENFKKQRRDDIIVSLAGVATNLVLAILITIIYAFVLRWIVSNWIIAAWATTLLRVLATAVNINLILMVFNLLPIPPLDGFNAVTSLLGIKYTEAYFKIYQYGMFIVMALIVFGVVRTVIGATVNPMFATLMGFAMRFSGL